MRRQRDSTAERLEATAPGLSLFTRTAARREPSLKNGNRGRSTLTLIDFERGRLRHLEAQLLIEDNPERRAKLKRNIDIKSEFIMRLQRENENDCHT